MIKKIFLLSSLTFLYLSCFSQAGSFISVPLDAQTTALGNTYIAQENNVSFYSNLAAGHLSHQKFALDVNYRPWLNAVSNDYDLFSTSAYYAINKKNSIAFGYKKYRMPSYTNTDENGNTSATFDPFEFSFGLAYAFHTGEKSAFSISINYLESDLSSAYTAHTFYLDLGFKSSFRKLNYGWMLRNLGPQLKFDEGSSELPLTMAGGLAYPISLSAKHSITSSLDISHVSSNNISGFYTGMGLQYQFNHLLTLRTGYRYFDDSLGVSAFSLGGGIHYKIISLDAAWLISNDILKNNFNLSCSFSFGKKEPQKIVAHKL